RLALVGGAGVVAAAALAGGTDLLSRPAKAASGQPILIDNTNDGSERTILVSSGPTGLGTVGAFEVFSQASSGFMRGVIAGSNSTDGVGIEGRADATSGITRGVHGISFSPQGSGVAGGRGEGPFRAVVGFANAPTGFNMGILGRSESPEGVGARGEAPGRGVTGFAFASTGLALGVLGQADSTDGRGVEGLATAVAG